MVNEVRGAEILGAIIPYETFENSSKPLSFSGTLLTTQLIWGQKW